MGLLLLGAVCAAALPLVVGVIAGAYLPEHLGGLRTDGGPWRLLHLLWVYPVLYVVATIVEGVLKHLGLGDSRAPAVIVVEALILWFALTLMFAVFFERFAGAALGAAVGLAVLVPFVRALDRAGDTEEQDAPRA